MAKSKKPPVGVLFLQSFKVKSGLPWWRQTHRAFSKSSCIAQHCKLSGVRLQQLRSSVQELVLLRVFDLFQSGISGFQSGNFCVQQRLSASQLLLACLQL